MLEIMKIDAINKKILFLLQKDARITYKEIADELHRSETTIRDRIKSMERVGLIQGYTALINKTALGLNFYAIILGNPTNAEDFDNVFERIKKVKNVLRVYQISGKNSLAIFIVSSSYDHIKEIIKNQLAPIGFINEEFIIVLQGDSEFLAPLEIP